MHRDFETQVRGHSRSLEMTPFDRLYTTSYSRPVVTMALYCAIFEIFDFEKYCNLEILVRGHSRSSIIVPYDSLSMVSY